MTPTQDHTANFLALTLNEDYPSWRSQIMALTNSNEEEEEEP